MSAPLNILHVCSGNLYGGVESVVISLLHPDNQRADLHHSCAYCFPGRLQTRLEEIGADTFQLGAVRLSQPASIVRARRKLQSAIAAKRPGVVICHSFWTLLIFGSVVKRHTKLVFWLHDVPMGNRWFRNATGVVERAARFIRPDLVIANSRYTAGFANQLFPQLPHAVIYCPVEPRAQNGDVRASVRDRFDVPADEVVIAQVGRLEEWKGHLLHLKALALLRDVPGWRCWIVGGAQRPHEVQYLARLEEFADRAGIAGRVHFFGQRKDVPQLLAAADLLCQPNTAPEAFGLVFVEALSAALPVVTTKMGGPMEIVDEECGLLVEPGNVNQIAEALRSLIVNTKLRHKLGSRGPARAEQISSPAQAQERLHAVLKHLTNASTMPAHSC